MNWVKLFIIVISVLLVGCDSGSNQVFIPEIHSDEDPTQTVFVPAVQSDESKITAKDRVTTATAEHAAVPKPTAAPQAELGVTNADVLFVKAQLVKDGTWTFYVTVSHPDTGWEDYADGWDVLLPDGTVLKSADSPFTRLLLHPHVDEQPFMRSQGGIEIPNEIDFVTVRAHDIVDGFGGKEIMVDLLAESGPGFEVQR